MSELLLAGGGHAHALVLRRWAMHPATRPPVESITLVSASSTSLYSGLIPAALSGALPVSECAIDLRELCRGAGVTFVQATIAALERPQRQLRLVEQRPPLRFQWLSLNVGAAVACPASAPSGPLRLPIKPLKTKHSLACLVQSVL